MNRLEYLTQEELKDLQEATLHILDKIRFVWTHRLTLKILTDAGCHVEGKLSPQGTHLWQLRCDCPGPARNSTDARDNLLDWGKSVDLLSYKDEGHSFSKIEMYLIQK